MRSSLFVNKIRQLYFFLIKNIFFVIFIQDSVSTNFRNSDPFFNVIVSIIFAVGLFHFGRSQYQLVEHHQSYDGNIS